MGRQLQLTPDVTLKICQAIALGATYEIAAMYGGISRSTFYEWLKRGDADGAEEPYAGFADAVRNAEAAGAIGLLAKIEQAANAGTWQAAAWKLERRYPKDYGRTVSEVTGPDGAPVGAGSSIVFYLPQKHLPPDDTADTDDSVEPTLDGE